MGDASQTPGIPPKADLADVILAGRRFFGELCIRLRRNKYHEYPVTLPVPGSLPTENYVRHCLVKEHDLARLRRVANS